MKVYVILAVFFCILGQILAHNKRLSDNCRKGVADRYKCCEGVSNEWYAHMRNPEDCSSFYQCENEKATWKPCPAGLEWSVAADKCDWPNDAQCKTGKLTNSESNASNGNNGTSNEGEKQKLPAGCYNGAINAIKCCEGITAWYIHLPDPKNCSKFFQCDNGKAVNKDCPAGLHWSIKADRCEWPQLAGCQGNTNGNGNNTTGAPGTNQPPTSTVAPSTTITPPTTIAPPPQADQCAPGPVCHQCITGIFPADLCCRDVKNYHKLNLANAKNCSSYYTCVNDHAVLRQCPDGLHWSIDTDRCEWPKNAKCKVSNEGGNNGGNTGGNGNGNNGGSNWQSNDCLYGKVDAATCCKNVPETVDVLLQNNADCHTYFQCVHGTPMVRPCPAGLWWSVTANRCEWKENATCTW